MSDAADRSAVLLKSSNDDLDLIAGLVRTVLSRDPSYEEGSNEQIERDVRIFRLGLSKPMKVVLLKFRRPASQQQRTLVTKSAIEDPQAEVRQQAERIRAQVGYIRQDLAAYVHATSATPSPTTGGSRQPATARPIIAPMPEWAWASALIALLTAGLSFAALTTLSVSILGIGTVAIAAAAARIGSRHGSPTKALLGLAPALLFVAFACLYGEIALLGSGTSNISYDGEPLHVLRDPLILSLSLLTTVDRLDIEVSEWVRSVAYIEMLLLAGLAGRAVILATRWANRPLDLTLARLESEAKGPEPESR